MKYIYSIVIALSQICFIIAAHEETHNKVQPNTTTETGLLKANNDIDELNTSTATTLAGIIVLSTVACCCCWYFIWRCLRTRHIQDIEFDEFVAEAEIPPPLPITLLRVHAQPRNPLG